MTSRRCLSLLIAFSINASFQVPVTTCFALPRNRISHQNINKIHHNKQGRIPLSLHHQPSIASQQIAVVRGGNTSNTSLTATNKNDVPPPQPTLRDLVNFALPCLALWISGPLLSLIDTASVGLTAKPGMGATELGALGPATTFIDGSTYLFAFLNVATTNLYASALAENAGDETKQKLAGDAVVRTAVKISLFCGFGIMALLFAKGEFLLNLYVGEQAAKTILGPATEYVRIRALSLPTSLLGGVLQAALLGSKDSVTPLIAVIASTTINIFGDGLLVVALKMGTAGAAIATTLAQWGGTVAMYKPARNKLLVSSKTPEQKAENKVTSKNFLAFAAPVLTLILGKLAAFGVMTHVAAALPGGATLAAHQIVLSLFFFVSPFLEVLSQTAQAFLPQYYVGESESFGNEARKLSGRLLRLGVTVGICIAALAASIPSIFPFILTNDPIVQTAVKPLALPLFLGSLLTAPVAVSEGVLLARRELKYLASVYVLSTIMFPFGLFKLKKSGGPVSNVWYGFVFFQLFRALCFTGRLWGGPMVARIASSLGLRKSTGTGSDDGDNEKGLDAAVITA
jgi:Na+-driven multidrug efflux pump